VLCGAGDKAVVCICCSFYDLVMEMIADRSSAVLDVESDVKLCSIKVYNLSRISRLTVTVKLYLQPSNHTHPHLFNGPFSGTTQVSRYQKGKTNLNFTEARDNEWQWHQLGRMQVCTSLQTDKHTSTPPLSFFTGQMPFLPPNQQHQSTGGSE